MKTLIVYASVHHDNTAKIANVLAEVLNAKLIKPADFQPELLESYDLIGFGSGIYVGKYHRTLLSVVTALPRVREKQSFLFSTSGRGVGSYNQPVAALLRKKGFLVTADFACKGWDSFGPFKLIGGIAKNRPNHDDLEAAKTFAQKLMD